MVDSCRWYKQLLERSLDGELSASEQQCLDRHLQRCGDCGTELELDRRVANAIGGLPQQPCPAELTRRLETAVAAGTAPASRHRHVRGWSLAALASAASLLVVAVLAGRLPAPDPLVHRSYSYQDVLRARSQARASLVFTASVISKTERNALGEVLTKSLAAPLKDARNDAVGTESAER
jgi:anti-sigma factor RsiW